MTKKREKGEKEYWVTIKYGDWCTVKMRVMATSKEGACDEASYIVLDLDANGRYSAKRVR